MKTKIFKNMYLNNCLLLITLEQNTSTNENMLIQSQILLTNDIKHYFDTISASGKWPVV